MRFASGITILLLGLSLQLFSERAQAQVVTAGPDSVMVLTPEADSVAQEKKFFLSGLKDLGRPGKAALFSAALPGLGQAYNGAYWKIPVIYATGAVLGYFLIDNNNKYQDFRAAVLQRRTNSDKYQDHPIYGVQRSNGSAQLLYSRDYYRRNRDLTIILSVGAYALNIAEAYVHAHLKDFDVGDNLTLRVQPDLFQTPAANSMTPGLTLTLYTRTK
ncbi:DUF5683 domain-containing protein [Pontibacter roseus]|uniref:DUF5683 domain-containing protein n=1 Tax=Pontibacter roseus TaxID=336989 RepID=UPI00035D212F|nr:DUF5683 domain-containing protein [Pontibacter roseus]